VRHGLGVDGAVLVSPFSMYRYDASYVLEVQAKHPDRFCLIKPVDPNDPAVADIIADWKAKKDRTKDLIKSGGEWISSIELENIAVAHPAIRKAAVVAPIHTSRPTCAGARACARGASIPEVLCGRISS
jgi:hypothetical protein